MNYGISKVIFSFPLFRNLLFFYDTRAQYFAFLTGFSSVQQLSQTGTDEFVSVSIHFFS